ncbi:NTP transferase domain-containing protein [Luteolibacter yonseiensis]|uniref:NTP transferase domain-containing protein n=1 Tax=Luteolibacter yonseiensis TaxID=1144680 RepID=A0A934R6C9_9BACT|nr:sugar phosphate nucleotidyltransferase [Luteolibacter yonseiensis]MBK1816070.1 NTP transferase domain-containing protein [Luteolibacter yonseiensis]
MNSRLPPVKAGRVKQAFILGAGLGNRLRPLTGRLPKPLVPLFHQPLAGWAVEACAGIGIDRFAVNTHHLPEAWEGFGAGRDVTFFHEPDLLETGGGLKNLAYWMGGDPLLVHNGDIFSTMPLEKLVSAHKASGLPVTLALRSEGVASHIALDESGTRVRDIRNMLGIAGGTHVFSGIYCVNPDFLELIPAGEKISVIPAFLELAKEGTLGAIILDEGVWLDLGDRESYLQAHRELALAEGIHPEARIGAGAVIERSAIGPGSVVEEGAVIRDSVIWPGARVSGDAVLDRCIVFSDAPVGGSHQDADL